MGIFDKAESEAENMARAQRSRARLRALGTPVLPSSR
jgi:hypothetical protein